MHASDFGEKKYVMRIPKDPAEPMQVGFRLRTFEGVGSFMLQRLT
jgi:hypothetical protein